MTENGESTMGEENIESNERILAFILAVNERPGSRSARTTKGGEEYLQNSWGFTDEDIAYISAPRADVPATLAMTVWPQPTDRLAAAADGLGLIRRRRSRSPWRR